ncbi:MAG TPA: glycosyl hydrolase-related protein, partial [Gemmatimonadota bacterium]|nr:glycosyl hydrolase-related protein [Gemmatimonadota bacterium]
RYSLQPHDRFDESRVERFARGVAQPLVTLPVRAATPPLQPPFIVEARRSVITRLANRADGDAHIVRLYNPGAEPDSVAVRGADGARCTVQRADAREQPGEALDGLIELRPYDIVTLRVRCN